jgi:uncharacterized membrane protein (DUF373 family)
VSLIKEKTMKHENEPLIANLQKVIYFSVRILAILMTFVIFWGVIDVCWILYKRLSQPPYFLLNISDILATFGAFLAVLIAIEIFINITIYLKEEIIHVKIVMATALMAIARKVIVFDFKEILPMYVFATAAVILALSIGYWLVTLRGSEAEILDIKADKNENSNQFKK